MAEINIEPKKKSSWSWIIVVLILALVAWLVYRYFLEPRTVDPETQPAPAAGYVIPSPVLFPRT